MHNRRLLQAKFLDVFTFYTAESYLINNTVKTFFPKMQFHRYDIAVTVVC